MSAACEDCRNSDPCCYQGDCDAGDDVPPVGMCIHCGAEMFEERGFWFHHSQADIPFSQRNPQSIVKPHHP